MARYDSNVPLSNPSSTEATPARALSFEDARRLVERHAGQVSPGKPESLDLLAAAGRVLAEEIRADLAQLQKLTESLTASGVGVTLKQFREATGQTVVNYIARLRIQFAAQCLLATGDILDSALEAGFADLTHFYRVFKRQIGTTPKEFLVNARGSKHIS